MVTSEIFLGTVYLDNTPEGRAVMIQPLLVFLTHPNVRQMIIKFQPMVTSCFLPLIFLSPVCSGVISPFKRKYSFGHLEHVRQGSIFGLD